MNQFSWPRSIGHSPPLHSRQPTLTDWWFLAETIFTASGSQMTRSLSEPTDILPLRGYRLKILAAFVLVTATNWFSSIFPVAYWNTKTLYIHLFLYINKYRASEPRGRGPSSPRNPKKYPWGGEHKSSPGKLAEKLGCRVTQAKRVHTWFKMEVHAPAACIFLLDMYIYLLIYLL